MSHVLGPVLAWWLAFLVLGVTGLPLARALMPTLPDRGFSVARPLALLLAGGLWWWLVILGLLPNSTAGAVAAVLIVAGGSVALSWSDRHALLADLRDLRSALLRREALFALVLVAWALYRSFYPDVTQSGGEKTMELAFLSAVLESPSFPPRDPWMAGQSISYYYMSYVLGALMVRITGLAQEVAFNLLVPGTMAMTVVAAYGMGANLVRLSAGASRRAARAVGAGTAAALALAGSLEGVLEVAYRVGAPGPRFYQWLAIFDIGGTRSYQDGAVRELAAGACGKVDAVHNELAQIAANQPAFSPSLIDLMPQRHIWWWRGSRVIRDACTEAIHEFPFFSFMLADAHPHVLGLPFVILTLSVALALLAGSARRWRSPGLLAPEALLAGAIVGALAFLNTWDLPTYGLIVVVAFTLRAARSGTQLPGGRREQLAGRWAVGVAVVGVGWLLAAPLLRGLRTVLGGAAAAEAPLPLLSQVLLAGALGVAGWLLSERVRVQAELGGPWTAAWSGLRFAAWLGVLAVLLYLPFHLGFASQAAGIGRADFSSRPAQWIVHWGLPYSLAVGTAAAGVLGIGRRLVVPVVVSVLLMALPSLAWWPPAPAWAGWALAVLAGVAAVTLLPRLALQRDLAAPTTGVLVLAGAGGAVALAAWGWMAPPLLPPESAQGGSPGWMPWTPLLVAAPMIAAASAGLERWWLSSATWWSTHADVPPEEAARTGQPEPDTDPLAATEERGVAEGFALLCVTVGLLVILGCEFVYIRDLFNSRMNTIFKLFFQGWALLAIGGGWGAWALWRRLPRPAAVPWLILLVLLGAASAVYPAASVWHRTGGLALHTLETEGLPAWLDRLSLDGLRYWQQSYPEDLSAVRWLRDHAPRGSVLLEATGGGYSHTGRISMATGMPTVLGPDGHEHQWRGTREEIDPRKRDVEAFFGGAMSEEAMRQLLQQHGVAYIVVGGHERAQHDVPPEVEQRLQRLAALVFENGQTRIYERGTE